MKIRIRTLSRTLMLVLASTAMLGLTIISQKANAASHDFIILGTGGVTGVYYPAGGAICRVINRERKETGVRCSVESTQGSVANLNNMSNGELDLAIAQSDVQYHAYNGSDIFESTGPNKDLRSLFALHSEPFTVVASKKSGIITFDDLAGKRVNIGNPGSGQRATMEALMRLKGWSKNSFEQTSELSSAEQAKALCDDKIDVFVFSVGHPAGSLKEAANSCDVVMVSVSGPEVDKLVSENSFYRKSMVPGGVYRGNNEDIPTFGVSASLMTSAATDDKTVYLLVKSVFENIESMKKMHPAFNDLNPDDMIKHSSVIPVHSGAIKYFKEMMLSSAN